MTRFYIRKSIVLALAVTLGQTLFGASQAADLRIATLPIMDTLPILVAHDEGIFKKHGLNSSITLVTNQQIIMGALMSKSHDIGLSVPPTVMQAKDAGIDLVIVAGATEYPRPENYAGLLMREGSGIKKAADLAGKKIAVAGLNAYHYFMTVDYLQRNNVDPKSVTFVEVAFPQQGDVLKSGQVDAVVTVDPFYGRIVGNKIGYSIEEYDAHVPTNTLIDFYVSTRAWAKENPETVKALRAALNEAIAFIKTNEKASRASLQRWSKLPESVVALAKFSNFKTEVEGKQLQHWIELGKRQGFIKTPMTGNDLVFQ
jgi:NitT/TauT family transport system substrate-binding protein